VTGAVILIVAFLLGLPLLAWWLGSRPVLARHDADAMAAVRTGPWASLVRERGLTWQQANQVRDAVARGREVQDERLRPVAVAWARYRLDQDTWRRRPVLTVLAVAWAGGVLAATAVAVTPSGGGHVPVFGLILVAGFAASLVRHRGNLRRAIALNGGPTTAADES
jgi:hypothetical protein